MSLHSIGSSIAQTGLLPQVAFGGSGRKKSGEANAAASDAGTIGQIPVGAGQNLLANALQALEQAIGAQNGVTAAAASATGAAGATSAIGAATSAQTGGSAAASRTSPAATTTLALDLQGFLHSLFAALRQDGSSGASGPTTANTASSVTASGGGPSATAYQGSVVSSLQTLIQQLSGGAPGSQATANLSNSFNNLVQGLKSDIAGTAPAATTASSAGASAASNAQLTTFLDGLLQKIQGNGSQAPNLLGAHVNANV